MKFVFVVRYYLIVMVKIIVLIDSLLLPATLRLKAEEHVPDVEVRGVVLVAHLPQHRRRQEQRFLPAVPGVGRGR